MFLLINEVSSEIEFAKIGVSHNYICKSFNVCAIGVQIFFNAAVCCCFFFDILYYSNVVIENKANLVSIFFVEL